MPVVLPSDPFVFNNVLEKGIETFTSTLISAKVAEQVFDQMRQLNTFQISAIYA